MKKTNNKITWEMVSTEPNLYKIIFDADNDSYLVGQMFGFDKDKHKFLTQLYQIKNDYIIAVYDRHSKRYNYFLYVNTYIKNFYNKK